MKKDIKQLAKDVLTFDKALKHQMNEGVKEFAVTQISFLAVGTPIDTGKAISNWLASVGFPKTKEVEPHAPGRFGSTKQLTVAETIAAAKESVKKKKLGQSLYITNNIQYMDALNKDGHSPQAPPGFIEAISDITERNWKLKFPAKIG